jgi:type II secretory pathway pseudopilin PulG
MGKSPLLRITRLGLSLAELLVVTVVLALLIGLAFFAVAATRRRAWSTSSEANIRQLGILISAYSADFRDMPPTVFAPIEQFMSRLDEPQRVQTRHGIASGYWFSNSTAFVAVLDEVPPARTRRDGSMPRTEAETQSDTFETDFALTNTLYALPDYWNRETQRGPEQWDAIPMTLVGFPSQKGMMRQLSLYRPGGDVSTSETCCTTQAQSAVLWFDLSAESLVQSSLIHGEPNFWHFGNVVPLPLWATGVPIDSTRDGVLGRDR